MTGVTQTVTLSDLLQLSSDARVEISHGEIITMAPVGGLYHLIAGNIYTALNDYTRAHQNGLVFMDGLLYILSAKGDAVRSARVPDVSFVSRESIPGDWKLEQPFPGAPTLAVEVMSLNDQFEEVVRKVHEYLDAGTEEVWVVLPREKALYRYHLGESRVQTYGESDSLSVEGLFPGLRLALADLFALPDL